MRCWPRGLWPQVRRLIVHGGTLCQLVLYPWVFAAGVYMLINQVPNVVSEEMGAYVHQGWALLLVTSPLLTLAGWWLRRGREHLADVGPVLSITGNLGATGALAAYVTAVVQASWIGRGMFSVFLVVAFMELTALIAVRDVLHIRDADRVRKVVSE